MEAILEAQKLRKRFVPTERPPNAKPLKQAYHF